MVKRKRSLEEMERRAKIRELLQMSNITSMQRLSSYALAVHRCGGPCGRSRTGRGAGLPREAPDRRRQA